MEEKDRTLGLRSVVSISVGLVIATSCLVSLGQGAGSIGVVFIGAMVIACLLNIDVYKRQMYCCKRFFTFFQRLY